MAEIVKVNAKELKSFGEQNFAPNVVYQNSEIKALTELAILHVVQPPPAAEDHNEVHAKLAQGRFE